LQKLTAARLYHDSQNKSLRRSGGFFGKSVKNSWKSGWKEVEKTVSFSIQKSSSLRAKTSVDRRKAKTLDSHVYLRGRVEAGALFYKNKFILFRTWNP